MTGVLCSTAETTGAAWRKDCNVLSRHMPATAGDTYERAILCVHPPAAASSIQVWFGGARCITMYTSRVCRVAKWRRGCSKELSTIGF